MIVAVLALASLVSPVILPAPSTTLPAASQPDEYAGKREEMAREQIEARGVKDRRVLGVMRKIPRHFFVTPGSEDEAYGDHPVPIEEGQTISQPYIVALMTETLAAGPGMKVLEVGTGSGYQAAVLAEMGCEVYSIEIIKELCVFARRNLDRAGIGRVKVIQGDGYYGLPGKAPFDRIIVTAAPDHVPPRLINQLKPGGRMVLPVGPEGGDQRLLLITKDRDGKTAREEILPVIFVPLTGGHETR